MRLLVGLLAAVALAGCGGSSDDKRLTLTTPEDAKTPQGEAAATPAPSGRGKGVTREEDATIRGWANALRHGKVDRAVRYWAVPAVFSNGEPPVRLPTARAIRAVNAGFPCGAKVESTRRDPDDRRYVVAVFVLTERVGGAGCGSGAGQKARTAFRIRHHKIVEWLRLADPEPEPADSASS
jgi:hypothetical protein